MKTGWLSPMAEEATRRRAEEALARLKKETDETPEERVPMDTPIRIGRAGWDTTQQRRRK